MLRVAVLSVAAARLLRLADPFCKTGVVSADLYSCCPKSCGSCDDANAQCTAGGDLADLEQGGCCPSQIKGGSRSCDHTRPPCELGDDYRNPPGADALDALAATERHAKDDCNEAVPQHSAEMALSVHFAAKEGAQDGGLPTECGSYADLTSAARACIADEDCLGFTTKGGTPDCLLHSVDPGSGSGKVYYKVKDQAGHDVPLGIKAFYGMDVSGTVTTTTTTTTTPGRQCGILNGELQPGASVLGSCEGTQDGVFVCSGRNNYIKWDHHSQYIEAKVTFDKRDGTAATFVMWASGASGASNTPSTDTEGSPIDQFGFDGGSKSVFYEGTNFGKAVKSGSSPIQPGFEHTITFNRLPDMGEMKVTIEDQIESFTYWTGSFPAPVAVGFRPWRNTIRVRELCVVDSE